MESTKAEFIQAEIETLKKTYNKQKGRNKRKALWIKLVTALLAATATILLGWQNPPQQDLFQNTALVLNAVITVFAAYEVFFEPKKLWVRDTLLFSRIKDIERDLKFELAGKTQLGEEKLAEYKNKINEMLEKSLSEWVEDKQLG